jgi:transcriptional regulator with PAS, ATPase and Fis domain
VNEYKKSLIEDALEKHDDNWTAAAKSLGISRQNMRGIFTRIK